MVDWAASAWDSGGEVEVSRALEMKRMLEGLGGGEMYKRGQAGEMKAESLK